MAQSKTIVNRPKGPLCAEGKVSGRFSKKPPRCIIPSGAIPFGIIYCILFGAKEKSDESVSLDRDTGAPAITIDVREARGVESIEEVITMIAKIAERVNLCVVLDEFQDVQDVPDADVVLSRLRAMIQFLPKVPFVFLGSVRNSMHEIFDSPKSIGSKIRFSGHG